MAFEGLLITEIFRSIQGETSHSGLPYAFVRLTGCNLRCSYCDSAYAFKGGERKSIDEVVSIIRSFGEKRVLLTGGEPLLQRQTPKLARTLTDLGFEVSIETHGETSIEAVSSFCRIVLDIKTPGSTMHRGGYVKNFKYLKPTDEVKFVLVNKADYAFARQALQAYPIPTREILFSIALPHANAPKPFTSDLSLEWLAQQVLNDRLPVRLQTQLHKLIWGSEKTGV